MSVHLALIWHLHQPLYLHPHGERPVMPWVRLHALRAYTDMAWAVEQVEGVEVTFNITPSLATQLSAYQSGVRDPFWHLSSIPADGLDEHHRQALLTHFFSCHWPTMVEPYPRYRELLHLRGRGLDPGSLREAEQRFTPKDWRDLQVWFNLAWMGFAAAQEPLIKELRAKGRGFSEEEKEALLRLQEEILGRCLPRYRELLRSGRIEITTSPFHHPILPLIIDTDVAGPPIPARPLPKRFSFPEDGLEQLRRARERMEEFLGAAPRGLWPPEGGVSPEVVSMVLEAGYCYMATDEIILRRSLGRHPGAGLLKPWMVTHESGELPVLFRHATLSGLIGSRYGAMEPEEAVNHFITALKELDIPGAGQPPLVTVVLDGENVWEGYPDGGRGFLLGLYRALAQDQEISTTTPSRYLASYPPRERLRSLHAGSWIGGDFSIWIGGREENRAWELLRSAREEVAREEEEVGRTPQVEAALEHLYVAEGSDWFWWLGDQFESSYSEEFDALFRARIRAAYEVLGRAVPREVDLPIKGQGDSILEEEPVAFITPEIDGQISFYWEWAGAGRLSPRGLGQAMFRGRRGISALYYGFDSQRLYLRLDPEAEGFGDWPDDTVLIFTFKGRRELTVECGRERSSGWSAAGKGAGDTPDGLDVEADEILELALPYELIGLVPGDRVRFCVEMARRGIVEARIPPFGYITVTVPDQDFERRLWMV